MKLRTQFLAIIAVPVLGLAAVAGSSMKDALGTLAVTHHVETTLVSTATIGDLIHELQAERGMSAGFIASKGANFADALRQQRGKVDEVLARLDPALARLPKSHAADAATLTARLADLDARRDEVTKGTLAVAGMAAAYTAMIRAGLDLNASVLADIPIGAIATAGAAQVALNEGKEDAGLGRAAGATGFSLGAFDPALKERFLGLAAAERAELADARRLAERIMPDLDLASDPALAAVERLRDAVRQERDLSAISGPDWFAKASAWIDRLRQVDVEMSDRISDLAAERSAAAFRAALLHGIVGAVTLVASILGLIHAQRIASALLRIGGAMRSVSARDYDIEVPCRNRRDEIGDFAENVEDCRAKLAEGEAAAQMALFKARAFTGSPAGMMLVDRELNIVDYNPALRQIFQDNLASFRARWPSFDPDGLNEAPFDLFHRKPDEIRRLLADPSRLPYSTDIALGDSRLQLSVSAIRDDAGAYLGTTLQWRDVRVERSNAAIIDAIRLNQTMLEFDTQFRVSAINETFTRVFGWGEEALGMKFTELFGVSDDTRIAMERLNQGKTVTRKVQRPTKQGGSVWIEVAMNPVMNGEGELDRVIEVGTDITKLEQVRIDAEADRARHDAEQATLVEELRRGLAAFAEGNLTEELEVPFAPELEQLRTDYNSARVNLAEAITRIVAAASNIGAGASEMAQASDDLARRTEAQAATLEETAAALEEMTGSVSSSAEGASDADKAMGGARRDAEVSGEIVDQAVAAMGEIEKSAEQIDQIIGVIDDIAFQTNLLALNAGVEAARAGEAGRGFAVVASEVRSLAQRSSEAAKEIKALISTSSDNVDRGVELVGRTGEALKAIVEGVGHVSALVTTIASAAQEQSMGISEINTGVSQLDQVTQQNAAMVEEATAISHTLRQEADGLSDLVGKFRVDGLSRLSRLAAARPGLAGRPAPAPEAKGSAPVKATGTGDWSDF